MRNYTENARLCGNMQKITKCAENNNLCGNVRKTVNCAIPHLIGASVTGPGTRQRSAENYFVSSVLKQNITALH